MKTVWSWIKKAGSAVAAWSAKYPLAVLLFLLTLVVGIVLAVFGRTIGAGGLLGRLFQKTGEKRDELKDRNSVPEDRKDEDGKPIAPGESDDKGFVQAPTDKMEEPGLFDDKDSVKVKDPDGKDVTIPLPVGVENKGVKDVIVIQPDTQQVKNNDTGVDAGAVLDILKRGRK